MLTNTIFTYWRTLFVAALLISGARQAGAEDPPSLKEYKGRSIAQTMHFTGAPWLIRANREEEENGRLMLEQLQIKPGQTICDLGCGNGYHSLVMAEKTGAAGLIYAVDVQQEMLDMLQRRAGERNITNIKPVLGKYWDPNIPPGSCDLILLVDVYHEFSHPVQMLTAMHQALKPGGQVALVEYRAEDDRVPIKPEHKMTRAQIMTEWLPAGFALEREFQGLPWQHLLFFRQRRTGEPDTAPPPLLQAHHKGWTVEETATLRCTHIQIDGDLTLKNGGLVTLEDCHLEITGGHSLLLEGGGLITRRCTIGGTSEKPAGILMEGSAWEAHDTTLEHTASMKWTSSGNGTLKAARLSSGPGAAPLQPGGKGSVTLTASRFPLSLPDGIPLLPGSVPDREPDPALPWKLSLRKHVIPGN